MIYVKLKREKKKRYIINKSKMSLFVVYQVKKKNESEEGGNNIVKYI